MYTINHKKKKHVKYDCKFLFLIKINKFIIGAYLLLINNIKIIYNINEIIN